MGYPNVQAFNDSNLGEVPPGTSVPKGATPSPMDRVGSASATGMPSAVIKTDGTENIRADYYTEGPTTYGKPGKGVRAWPAIQSYNGESV